MEEIDKFFCRIDLVNGSSSGSKVEIPFDIKPREYIDFAKSDLDEKTRRGLVNALSNAKRAIHCQIDVILFVFGLFTKSRDDMWNFPMKMKTIKDIIPVAPKILDKINRRRNLLEHDFIVPKNSEVEDFIDVTDLFIHASDRYHKKFVIFLQIMSEADLENDSNTFIDESCDIEWDPVKQIFEFNYRPKKGKIIVHKTNPHDDDFIKYCKYYSKAIHLD